MEENTAPGVARRAIKKIGSPGNYQIVRKMLKVGKYNLTSTSSIVELIYLKMLAKMDVEEKLARIIEEEKQENAMTLEETRRALEWELEEAKMAAENTPRLLETIHEKEYVFSGNRLDVTLYYVSIKMHLHT